MLWRVFFDGINKKPDETLTLLALHKGSLFVDSWRKEEQNQSPSKQNKGFAKTEELLTASKDCSHKAKWHISHQLSHGIP